MTARAVTPGCLHEMTHMSSHCRAGPRWTRAEPPRLPGAPGTVQVTLALAGIAAVDDGQGRDARVRA
jgi:hypothetical protein